MSLSMLAETIILIKKVISISIPFTNRTLAHTGKDIKNPFLKALASKEEANRSGKMTVCKMFLQKILSIFMYLYTCILFSLFLCYVGLP